MSPWLGAAFLAFGAIALLRVLALANTAQDVVLVAQRSLGVLLDDQLDDEAKEARLQANALALLRSFLVLTAGGALAFSIPYGVLWLLDRVRVLALEQVLDVAISPKFLLASTVLTVLAIAWKSRSKATPTEQDSEATGHYTPMDKALHRVAFQSARAQVSLAALEDRLWAQKLSGCPAVRPVFVTGLPRAGTTVLLEILAKSPEFAAHCYRDMPFALTPCLWRSFASRFQRDVAARERAHGDGMVIGLESPEALEEMIWKTFWSDHYQQDRILPWVPGERNGEFIDFLSSHMRKIALLRRGPGRAEVRYVSKNNLNIARPLTLRRFFPDCTIIVPFRTPVEHASSLLHQHRQFLRMHRDDQFASEYMRGLGHFDFGENLRPVDFAGWLDGRSSESAETLVFWLEYWTATYEFLLSQHEADLTLTSYEQLCSAPAANLRYLCSAMGAAQPDSIIEGAARMTMGRQKATDTSGVPAPVLSRAWQVHAALLDKVRSVA